MFEDARAIYARALAREMASWHSIEIVTEERPDFSGMPAERRAAGRLADVISYRYIETREGQRRLDLVLTDAEGPYAHRTLLGDGERSANVSYDEANRQNFINVVPSFGQEENERGTQRPDPLRYLYLDKQPLEQALAGSTHHGPSEHLDRPCDRFLFEAVHWTDIPQDMVYHLDRETGLPVRVESYLGAADRERGRPLWVWEAEAIERVEGHLFPIHATLVTYAREEGGASRRVDESRELTVKQVQFNREYPASTFWPTFEPGTRVWDVPGNKDYVVPGAAPRAEGAGAAAPVDPIRVAPPPAVSLALTWGLLLAGAAALVAGLVLRRHA